MSKNSAPSLSSLLTYPFEEGILTWPEDRKKTLIWGAPYWLGAQDIKNADVVQGFYPDAREWNERGIQTMPEISDNAKYQTILCALPKQKEASFYHLAMSLKILNKNGLFVAVAANDAGGKRLEKWFQEFGLAPASFSKSKCRIVWAYKSDVNNDAVHKYAVRGAQQDCDIEGQKFITQPGIFGWDKIDRGSRLLTGYLPDDLRGVGADFGCGYGFLANYVLNHCPKIKKMIAIEANYNALKCAKENLKNFEFVDYQWNDLTHKIERMPPLDFIVMNPPFHSGKKADSDIGQKFIENAAECLKKNGVLYMVANAHLPYEKLLKKQFFKIEKLDENQGFKVYKAVK